MTLALEVRAPGLNWKVVKRFGTVEDNSEYVRDKLVDFYQQHYRHWPQWRISQDQNNHTLDKQQHPAQP